MSSRFTAHFLFSQELREFLWYSDIRQRDVSTPVHQVVQTMIQHCPLIESVRFDTDRDYVKVKGIGKACKALRDQPAACLALKELLFSHHSGRAKPMPKDPRTNGAAEAKGAETKTETAEAKAEPKGGEYKDHREYAPDLPDEAAQAQAVGLALDRPALNLEFARPGDWPKDLRGFCGELAELCPIRRWHPAPEFPFRWRGSICSSTPLTCFNLISSAWFDSDMML